MLIIAGSLAAVAAVSCTQTETDEVNKAEAVAGTYSGWTDAACQYFDYGSMVTEGESVTITVSEDGDNLVNVSFESASWGTFSFPSASVSGSDPYTLSGEGTCVMGMGDSTSEYTAGFSATIGVAAATATMEFTAPGVMGGLTILFTLGELSSSEGE